MAEAEGEANANAPAEEPFIAPLVQLPNTQPGSLHQPVSFEQALEYLERLIHEPAHPLHPVAVLNQTLIDQHTETVPDIPDQENTMATAPTVPNTPESSFQHKLDVFEGDVKGFFAKVAGEWRKAKQAWVMISSPQTRAWLIQVGADGLKAIRDSDAAVESKGLNLQLDEQVVADGKQLIADARAGEGVIVNDLKILGITL